MTTCLCCLAFYVCLLDLEEHLSTGLRSMSSAVRVEAVVVDEDLSPARIMYR